MSDALPTPPSDSAYDGYGGIEHTAETQETDETKDVEPNKELQTLTTHEQAACNEAHKQILMVGYENVTSEEQNGIVEGLLGYMNLMLDDEDEMPELVSDSDSDDDDRESEGHKMAPPFSLLVTQSSDYSEEESSSVDSTVDYAAKLASGVD